MQDKYTPWGLDFETIEARVIAHQDVTPVHIRVGPNVSAHDVAELVAKAKPGDVFVVEVDSTGNALDDLRSRFAIYDSPQRLSDAFTTLARGMAISRLTAEGMYQTIATVKSAPKSNKPHGPQRIARKGKAKRW